MLSVLPHSKSSVDQLRDEFCMFVCFLLGAALSRIKGPAQDAADGAQEDERGERGERVSRKEEPPPLEPFILHHGMAGNAAEWVMFGPGKSLGEP